MTAAPTLTEPASEQNFHGEAIKVAYTLPEGALAGSVRISLIGAHAGVEAVTLSNSAAGAHTATLVPSNLASGAGVASAPAGALPAESYLLGLS